MQGHLDRSHWAGIRGQKEQGAVFVFLNSFIVMHLHTTILVTYLKVYNSVVFSFFLNRVVEPSPLILEHLSLQKEVPSP